MGVWRAGVDHLLAGVAVVPGVLVLTMLAPVLTMLVLGMLCWILTSYLIKFLL